MGNTSSFKQRYKYWKETGELPYKNGIKQDLESNKVDDSPVKSSLPGYEGGLSGYWNRFKKKYYQTVENYINYSPPTDKRRRAMYSTIDPRRAYPKNIIDAGMYEGDVIRKAMSSNPDKMSYAVGNTPGDLVSDAAWRKRLGFPYDRKLIIPNLDGSYRLPTELEQEIPTDTTMLKNRIANTERLMQISGKYKNNKSIQTAKQVDQDALDALRHTYKTGEPVTVNEHAFNSRQWVSGGEIVETMSPLNILQNYSLQYDKQNNRMIYRDLYDFNGYDWAIPGDPFYIRGFVDLNNK